MCRLAGESPRLAQCPTYPRDAPPKPTLGGPPAGLDELRATLQEHVARVRDGMG